MSTVSMALLARGRRRRRTTPIDTQRAGTKHPAHPLNGGDVTPDLHDSLEVFSWDAHDFSDSLAVRVSDRHPGELSAELQAESAEERVQRRPRRAMGAVLDLQRDAEPAGVG